jgi:hypothetical protein
MPMPFNTLCVTILSLAFLLPSAVEAQTVSATVDADLNGVPSSDSQSSSSEPVSASLGIPGAANLDFSGDGAAIASQRPDGVGAVFVEALLANGTPSNVISSQTTWSSSDTNNLGGAVAYEFSYTITPAKLWIGDFAGLTENHFPRPTVSYSLVIRANSLVVFQSSATLTGGFNSHLLTEGGTSLNPTFAGGGSVFGYDFQSRSDTIDLGLVGPGESITVEYEMTATVSTGGNEAGGLATIGDPFDLDGSPGFSGSLLADGVVAVESRSWAGLKSLYD